MKNIFTFWITVLVCALSPLGSFAAEDGTLSNIRLKKNGENLDVTFNVNIENPEKTQRYTYIPQISHDGESLTLPGMTVAGKKRAIADSRKKIDVSEYIITDKKSGNSFNYTYSLPWESWMNLLSLSVSTEQEGCCSVIKGELEDVVKDKLLYYEVKPSFDTKPLEYELTELEKYDIENPFLHPMETYPERYNILLNDRDKGTSKVIFKVGSSVIDTEFQGNGVTLEAITKAFDLINNDPNAILKHIVIAGYASPEGPLALNTRLGLARAESVKKFILPRMTDPSEHYFEMINGREDWAGLREQVAKCPAEWRDEILEIIDAYSIEEEIRKTKLKQFRGGEPYRYMLEHFYPSLRTGGYVQVYYEIDRKATVAAAVTDEHGRTTYVDPESPENIDVTRVNRAIQLMIETDFNGALEILNQLGSDEKALNIIGVCHMMKGDYNKALGYFERAIEAGDEDARKNIEEISIIKRID